MIAHVLTVQEVRQKRTLSCPALHSLLLHSALTPTVWFRGGEEEIRVLATGNVLDLLTTDSTIWYQYCNSKVTVVCYYYCEQQTILGLFSCRILSKRVFSCKKGFNLPLLNREHLGTQDIIVFDVVLLDVNYIKFVINRTHKQVVCRCLSF